MIRLKIKDEIDLKVLEKFGFVHEEETKEHVERFIYREEIVDVCRISVYNREIFCIEALHKLFDLIKADLVEKRIEPINHLFQFIKWEDAEAYNIEELLKQ